MTDLSYFERHFESLPAAAQNAIRDRLLRLKGADPVAAAREGFMPFVRRVWPEFVHGRHHDVMADVFERIERGELKRAIINMPPRSTKSKFTSVLFPAWYLGHHPEHKIFEGSHSASLASDFGGELRDLVKSDAYQEIFPGATLRQDSRAKHRWRTQQGGEYFAVGKAGGAAGKGGNLVVIDDPHSEQDVLRNSRHEFEKTWKWYLTGPRQRLQPGAAILVVMTRWGPEDLTGRLIRQYTETDEELERWEVIELPAILPSGDALFPNFWTIEELQATRATMPTARWQANYQQNPISEEAAIIKKEWWRHWKKEEPPVCDFVVQSWDTAFSERESANRSACVTLGVFAYKSEEDPPSNKQGIILLDVWAGRVEFPELKAKAKEHFDRWKPDSLIIEKKASGEPLIQELRRMGIYIYEVDAHRSTDKVTRVHSVADMFQSGAIWAPLGFRWVEQLRDEVAAFPLANDDDMTDALVWGLIRIRRGNLIRLGSDEKDEEWKPRPPTKYY